MAASTGQRFLLWLFPVLCRLLKCTYRFQVIDHANLLRAQSMHEKRAFIIASWHQNCFAGILAHAGQNISLLVSKSYDGDLVGALASKLGMQTVRGSSSRGGRKALDELVETTLKGSSAAFTVDGPRGPLYSVKKGVFELAVRTGAPILPLLVISDRFWVLHKSWDKFRIPKPFSKVYVIYGPPFQVAIQEADNSIAALSCELAAELLGLEEKARTLCFQDQSKNDRDKDCLKRMVFVQNKIKQNAGTIPDL